MNRILLIVLTLLFLTACAGRTVKDDSPASDLDALVAAVKRELPKRNLPNGRLYCMELADTEQEQDDCGGDLEDVLFLSEGDKDSAIVMLQQGVERLKVARRNCGFFKKMFRFDKCRVEDLK